MNCQDSMRENGLAPEGGLVRPIHASVNAVTVQTEKSSEAAPRGDGGAAALARRLDAAYQEAVVRLAAGATRLVLAAAETVVRQVITTNPRVVEGAIYQALALIGEHVAVEVRVHPSDAAVARDICDRLHHAPRATVVEDATVSRGGCVISTEFGEVDATIEAQLRRLREILLEEG
jgi:flagellar assembly protein FliH